MSAFYQNIRSLSSLFREICFISGTNPKFRELHTDRVRLHTIKNLREVFLLKKWMIFALAALMLLTAVCASAEETAQAPVQLDYSTIIDGEQIYYSGSIDGGERGVFTMNADGSDPVRISGVTADLLALSGDHLLIYQYDLETGDSTAAVLNANGTCTPLAIEYGGKAIAADGRFYWGMGSCAADGSDIQIYFTGDAVNAYEYYPLAVHEGYYYYLDWSEMSGMVYAEGTSQPMGASLCRMKLADQTHEVISPLGTRFIAIENGLIYYTRDNYWCETPDGASSEVVVDQGLFAADVATLTETRLAEYPTDANAVDSYMLVRDGVVYGMHSDYASEDADAFCVIRVASDGTKLDSLPVSPDAWRTLSCVENGVLYVAECNIISSEDDFIQKDSIIAVNLSDGSETVLNPETIDMLFYSESDPAVKVVGDRIYFTAYDMERWSVCLKSMKLDGSDLTLLAHGVSFAEG